MTPDAVKARWIIMSRLYMSKYNAFLCCAPLMFKDLLLEIDVVSCEILVNRRRRVLFEPIEDLPHITSIIPAYEYLITSNRESVRSLIFQLSSFYKGADSNNISEYEEYLLRNWLEIDTGRHLYVDYHNRNGQ
jgi:hypothetical protein